MMDGYVTKTEFARRMGVSPRAVTRAINDGRITATLDERGRTWIEPGSAAREWSENSRFRIEASGAGQIQAIDSAAAIRSITESRAMREDYEARLAQLKYDTAVGTLVRADEVQAAWCSIIAATRTRLLAVPTKAKIRMPVLNTAQIEIIEDLIREALEDLSASGKAGGADDGS